MKSLLLLLAVLVGCGCPGLARGIDSYNEAVRLAGIEDLVSQAKFRAAKNDLLEAYKNCPFNDSELVRLFTLIARCYMEIGDFSNASNYLNQASGLLERTTEKLKGNFPDDAVLLGIAKGDFHYRLAKRALKHIEKGEIKEKMLELAINNFNDALGEYLYLTGKMTNKNISHFVAARVVGTYLEMAKTHELYTERKGAEAHLKKALELIEDGIKFCNKNLTEYSSFHDELKKYLISLEKEKGLIEYELRKF